MRLSLERERNLIFILALILLFALEAGTRLPQMQEALFFAHLGAILMWQPLLSTGRSLSARETLMIGGIAFAASVFYNQWTLVIWLALLAGLTAGRVSGVAPAPERHFYLAALGFLVVLLFTLGVPDLLPPPISALSDGARTWIEIALLLWIFLLIALALVARRAAGLRAAQASENSFSQSSYDLVYAVWVVALLLLLVFCGITIMTVTGRSYLASMGLTLIGMAVVMLLFSWAWQRFGGGGGTFTILLSRYLLSFGLPYERWLERLALLSRSENSPARFFDSAMRSFSELRIVQGAQWRGPGFSGEFGRVNENNQLVIDTAEHTATEERIVVTLHSKDVLSPSLIWHFKLLIQLTAEFHNAKAREERLRGQQYMRAVHETGARVTHDVKNLLQSLNGILGATATIKDDAQVRALIDRQLPVITQRLAHTLDKLKEPSTDSQRMLRLSSWYARLLQQYERQPVQFDGLAATEDLPIAQPLFDSVADNLLQNALQKRSAEPGLHIKVRLSCANGQVRLEVEDNGSAAPVQVTRHLFDAPVPSRTGLGIGLHHAARQARTLGYRLLLDENRRGCVRFCLTNA